MTRQEMIRDEFNQLFPVDESVWLRRDDGTELATFVRHEAFIAGNHQAVAFFDNIPGYYAIEGRVRYRYTEKDSSKSNVAVLIGEGEDYRKREPEHSIHDVHFTLTRTSEPGTFLEILVEDLDELLQIVTDNNCPILVHPKLKDGLHWIEIYDTHRER